MSRPAKQQLEPKSPSVSASSRAQSVPDAVPTGVEPTGAGVQLLAGADPHDPTTPALPTLAPAQRQQTILALQRTHGNAFVGRLVDCAPSSPPRIGGPGGPSAADVQRASSPWALAEKEKIAAALKSKDAADVKAIADVSQATEQEKLHLIRILVDQWWVGPLDRAKIKQIWESFGDQLPGVMTAQTDLWNACIKADVELDDPRVTALRVLFPNDVKTIVAGYLEGNLGFVASELDRMGFSLAQPAGSSPPTEEQTTESRRMQATAADIAKLQASQEAARNTYVGYDLVFYDLPSMFPSPLAEPDARHAPEQRYEPVTFNPFTGKPPHEKAPPGSFLRPVAPGDEGVRFARYDDLKESYDEATDLTTKLLERDPILYAVSREGKSAATAAFAGIGNPAQARAQLAAAMWRLLADILKARTKLEEGDLDPLDLTPVHAQLLRGAVPAPSGTQWHEPLPQSVAEELVRDHDFQNVLIELALQTAAAALFALAPLSGGASLYLALAGLAVTGAKLALSADQYAALAQASKTSVKPGTELVSGGQVESAALTVEADKTALTLATLALGPIAARRMLGAMPQRAAPIGSGGQFQRPARRRPVQEKRREDQPGRQGDVPGRASGRLRRPKPERSTSGQTRTDQPPAKQATAQDDITEVLPSKEVGRRRVRARVTWDKPLSSAGWKSSIEGAGNGVFDGKVPGVKEPVVIKVYPQGHDTFERELRGAKAAEKTGFGPKVYGPVDVDRPGKDAFAMEKVPGGMTEAATKTPDMSASEYAAAKQEAAYYRRKVNRRTVRDIQTYGDRLAFKGFYYSGDVQGLVDKAGRWRPVDFQTVRALPPETQPEARKAALKRHGEMVDKVRDTMRELADKNERSR